MQQGRRHALGQVAEAARMHLRAAAQEISMCAAQQTHASEWGARVWCQRQSFREAHPKEKACGVLSPTLPHPRICIKELMELEKAVHSRLFTAITTPRSRIKIHCKQRCFPCCPTLRARRHGHKTLGRGKREGFVVSASAQGIVFECHLEGHPTKAPGARTAGVFAAGGFAL